MTLRRLPSSWFSVLSSAQQPGSAERQDPIIVTIAEPDTGPAGLADVLIGSLGLTGVLILIAVLLGVVTAGLMFWLRSRSD